MRADLTNERLSALTYARNCIDTKRDVAAAIKYVFADKNCRLQASCTDGRLLSFTTADEFDGLLNYLDVTTHKNKPIRELIYYDRCPTFAEDLKAWDITSPTASSDTHHLTTPVVDTSIVVDSVSFPHLSTPADKPE
jgi:hypothetical protein